MEILSQIQHNALWFLLALTPLVFVHELGHFAVARWCGVRVEVFSIGFGRELFGFTDKTGTRWKFSWLPLGGYVRMFGQGENALEGEAARPMSAAERAVSFKDKSVGQRMAIVAAGPAANFLFAIVVLAVLYMVMGKPYLAPVAGVVTPGSAAADAGLQTGDRIVALNGSTVTEFNQIFEIVQLNLERPLAITVERAGRQIELTAYPKIVSKQVLGNDDRMVELGISPHLEPLLGVVASDSAAEAAGLKAGDRVLEINGQPMVDFSQVVKIVREEGERPLAITVDRAGSQIRLTATPKMVEVVDESGKPVRIPRLGIMAAEPETRTSVGLVDATVAAGQEVWAKSIMMLTGIWQMLTAERSATDIRGVLSIADMAGDVAKVGFDSFVGFAVLLSINLGLINLFPIPMLDGGHLVYYTAEAVRGKPLGERVQEYGLRVGLALVLCLMLFATWNDLVYLKVVQNLKSLFM